VIKWERIALFAHGLSNPRIHKKVTWHGRTLTVPPTVACMMKEDWKKSLLRVATNITKTNCDGLAFLSSVICARMKSFSFTMRKNATKGIAQGNVGIR
jgi:hypothetical protein